MAKQEDLEILIRPIRKEDIEILNEIHRMDGVRETITGITSKRISQSEQWFNSLTSSDHILVAEDFSNGKKRVLGSASIHLKTSHRFRHIAAIGIMVHADFHGKGIGRKLMNSLLDLADNWLNVVRLELSVSVNNDKAVNLYQSLGFKVEGTLKFAMFSYGKYEDLYLMARYHFPETPVNQVG